MRRVLTSFLFVMITLVVGATARGAESQTVLRLVTGEWPPFSSAQLPDSGSAVLLVNAVLESAGLNASIEFQPWDEAQRLVRSGEALAAFPFVASAPFAREFLLSDTLFSGKNCFVYHAGQRPGFEGFVFQGLEQLGRYRVGVLAGSFMEKDFQQAGLSLAPEESIDLALEELIAGRTDLYIDNTAVILDAIARRFPAELEQIRIVPGIYGDLRPNVMLVSRRNSDAELFLERFNQALDKLKETGRWDWLLRQLRLER
jgi:polar amino acid transport system substrate-binding protein